MSTLWKYVSRRIRDTFERSANHFDRRSTTVVNTQNGIPRVENKSCLPCWWITPRKGCSSFQQDDTNSKRWNFDELNRNWIGAITWSGALVVGWYASQLIHLKLKYLHRDQNKNKLSSLYPYVCYVNKSAILSSSQTKVEKLINSFTPTVHLMSNEQNGVKTEEEKERTESTSSEESLDNDLKHVLNSIENKLGLAAIESGQHAEGLNLLRSAAHRNHAPALFNLGLCYEMGLGVKVDEKMAMDLFRSAAVLEHPGALYNLGVYYGQGRGGLTTDKKTAIRLLRLAAVQGQLNAIDALKTLETEEQFDESCLYNYCKPVTPKEVIPSLSTLFMENVNNDYSRVF